MTPRGHRAGFTLVELLTAIAIMGILIALASTGIWSLVARQRANNTTAMLRSIHQALQKHWTLVVDQAKKEPIPPSVLGIAGSDAVAAQRARVMWIKIRLAEAFPVNDTEVNSPPYFNIPKLSKEAQFPNNTLYKKTLTSMGASSADSSACLLMALSVNRNGITLPADVLGSNVAIKGGVKELVDGWGNPITFFRFPWNNGSLQSSNPAGTSSKFSDPLDPLGLLANSTWSGANGSTFQTAIGYPLRSSNDTATTPAITLSLANYTIPVLVSAGPDGALGLDSDMFVNMTNDSSGVQADLDNLYDYQLRLFQ